MNNFYKIINIKEDQLKELDEFMSATLDISNVFNKLKEELERNLNNKLNLLGVDKSISYEELYQKIFSQIEKDEKTLYRYVDITPEDFNFEKIVLTVKKMGGEREGFFLKKDYAKKILEQCPPQKTMEYLGYSSINEMLNKEDVMDVFSALRFTENTEWMHNTFDKAYSNFTPNDFEKRNIDIRVLGNQWKEVAEKFVAKKHHNVSHLKEFGVIFINPIAESDPGKFIRDFALLLHYTHEIVFYSKLFEQYSYKESFNDKFLSLLRGDVPEASQQSIGDWLIIQRYLWKDDPYDKRLFVPRVNPESLHWRKAQQDIVNLAQQENLEGFLLWDDSDYLAYPFEKENEYNVVSFDLEDSAMSFVSNQEGRKEFFTYHQKEAIWNKIFASFVGGYDNLEENILSSIDKAVISF